MNNTTQHNRTSTKEDFFHFQIGSCMNEIKNQTKPRNIYVGTCLIMTTDRISSHCKPGWDFGNKASSFQFDVEEPYVLDWELMRVDLSLT